MRALADHTPIRQRPKLAPPSPNQLNHPENRHSQSVSPQQSSQEKRAFKELKSRYDALEAERARLEAALLLSNTAKDELSKKAKTEILRASQFVEEQGSVIKKLEKRSKAAEEKWRLAETDVESLLSELKTVKGSLDSCSLENEALRKEMLNIANNKIPSTRNQMVGTDMTSQSEDLAKLNRQNEVMEYKFVELNFQHVDLKENYQKALDRLTQMEGALQAANLNVASVRQKRDLDQIVIKELNLKIDGMEENLQIALTDLASLQLKSEAEKLALTKERDDLLQQIETNKSSAKTELDSLQQKIDSSEVILKDLSEKLAVKHQELAALKEQSTCNETLVTELQAQLDSKNQDLDRAMASIESKESLIRDISERLDLKDQELETAKADVIKFDSHEASVSAIKEQFIQGEENLKLALAEASKKAIEDQELILRLEEKEEKLQFQNNEMIKFDAYEASVAALREDFRQMEEKLRESLEKTKGELELSNKFKEEQSENLQAEIDRLKAELQSMEETLNSALSNTQARSESDQTVIVNLRDELKSVELKLQAAQSRISSRESNKGAAQEDALPNSHSETELAQQKQSLEAEVGILREELATCKNNLVKLGEDLLTCRANLAIAEDTITDYELDMSRIRVRMPNVNPDETVFLDRAPDLEEEFSVSIKDLNTVIAPLVKNSADILSDDPKECLLSLTNAIAGILEQELEFGKFLGSVKGLLSKAIGWSVQSSGSIATRPKRAFSEVDGEDSGGEEGREAEENKRRKEKESNDPQSSRDNTDGITPESLNAILTMMEEFIGLFQKKLAETSKSDVKTVEDKATDTVQEASNLEHLYQSLFDQHEELKVQMNALQYKESSMTNSISQTEADLSETSTQTVNEETVSKVALDAYCLQLSEKLCEGFDSNDSINLIDYLPDVPIAKNLELNVKTSFLKLIHLKEILSDCISLMDVLVPLFQSPMLLENLETIRLGYMNLEGNPKESVFLASLQLCRSSFERMKEVMAQEQEPRSMQSLVDTENKVALLELEKSQLQDEMAKLLFREAEHMSVLCAGDSVAIQTDESCSDIDTDKKKINDLGNLLKEYESALLEAKDFIRVCDVEKIAAQNELAACKERLASTEQGLHHLHVQILEAVGVGVDAGNTTGNDFVIQSVKRAFNGRDMRLEAEAAKVSGLTEMAEKCQVVLNNLMQQIPKISIADSADVSRSFEETAAFVIGQDVILSEAEGRITDLKGELEELRWQFEKEKADKVECLKQFAAEKEELSEQIEALTGKRDSLENKVSTTEEKIKECQLVLHEFNEKKPADLKNMDTSDISASLRDLLAFISTQDRTIAETKLHAEILAIDLDEHRQKIESLAEENSSRVTSILDAKEELTMKAKKEKEQLSARIKSLTEERDTLQIKAGKSEEKIKECQTALHDFIERKPDGLNIDAFDVSTSLRELLAFISTQDRIISETKLHAEILAIDLDENRQKIESLVEQNSNQVMTISQAKEELTVRVKSFEKESDKLKQKIIDLEALASTTASEAAKMKGLITECETTLSEFYEGCSDVSSSDLSASVKRLVGSLSNQEAALIEVRRDSESLREERDASNQKLQELSAENGEIVLAIQAAKDEVATQIKSLEDECRKESHKALKLEESTIGLISAILSCFGKDGTQIPASNLEKSIESVLAILEEAKKAREDLESNVSLIQAQKDKLEAERATLFDEISTLKEETQKLDERSQSLQAQLDDLASQSKDTNINLQEVLNELQDISSLVSELSMVDYGVEPLEAKRILTSSDTALRARIHGFFTYFQQKSFRLEEAVKDMKASQSNAKELRTLQDEIAALSCSNTDLESKFERVRSNYETFKYNVRTALDPFAQDLNKVAMSEEGLVESLRHTLDDMSSENERLSSISTAVESLKIEKETLNLQNLDLQTSCNSFTRAIRNFIETFGLDQRGSSPYANQWLPHNVEIDADSINTILSSITAWIMTTRSELLHVLSDLSHSNEDLARLAGALGDWDGSFGQLKGQNEEFQKVIQMRTREITSLQESLDLKSETVKELEKRAEFLVEENQRVNEKHLALLREYKKMKYERDRVERKIVSKQVLPVAEVPAEDSKPHKRRVETESEAPNRKLAKLDPEEASKENILDRQKTMDKPVKAQKARQSGACAQQ
ncbi:hypothetical protein HDU97_000904 [Phlyctochytrium planicorne]|nr:hypothetical protein HDU97_000904 [Phlyctochytrium planicorne]